MSCGCSNNSWGRPQNNCGCERPRPPYNPCLKAAKEIKDQIDDVQKAADCAQSNLNKLRAELESLEVQFERFVQAGCVKDICPRQDDCGCGCAREHECGCQRKPQHECGCAPEPRRQHECGCAPEPRRQSPCCR